MSATHADPSINRNQMYVHDRVLDDRACSLCKHLMLGSVPGPANFV